MVRRRIAATDTTEPACGLPRSAFESQITSPTNQERNHVMLRKTPLFVLAVGAVLVCLLHSPPQLPPGKGSRN